MRTNERIEKSQQLERVNLFCGFCGEGNGNNDIGSDSNTNKYGIQDKKAQSLWWFSLCKIDLIGNSCFCALNRWLRRHTAIPDDMTLNNNNKKKLSRQHLARVCVFMCVCVWECMCACASPSQLFYFSWFFCCWFTFFFWPLHFCCAFNFFMSAQNKNEK